MSSDIARSDEIDQLRQRLSEYERAFASAAPRLAAFKRLEELAREQKTTAEAIAIDAAIAVLVAKEVELRKNVDELTEDRTVAREELSTTLKHKKEMSDAMTLIQGEHDALAYEVSELISEIESIRLDAIRLMKERSALQLEVEALRNERNAVADEVHDEIQILEDPPAEAVEVPGTTIERRVVEERLAEEDVDLAPLKTEVDFSADEDADEAFSRFIEVDRGPDKARDWFVG